MIYPFEPYKIDTNYGDPRSYGPHEGLDLNGLGGGNTDCGTPLKAIFDGEVVHTSSSTKDYGNLLVLNIKGPWGERWVRYCHCQELKVAGGQVKLGDTVSLMGTTGNSTACHLHFDILKKAPLYWRYYAKNMTELTEYFEEPIAFLDKWKDTIASMPDWLRTMFLELGVDLTKPEQEIRGKVQEVIDGFKKAGSLQEQVNAQVTQIATFSAQVASLTEEVRVLKEKLNQPVPPVEIPSSNLLSQVWRLILSLLGKDGR